MLSTQKEVKELFEDKDGILYWRENYRCWKKGNIAGLINNMGYRVIQIDKKAYLHHRLIFLYHNGYLPEEVDHIDGDTLNNLVSNLRACTHRQNMENQKKPKNNTSGVKGVWFRKDRNRWVAEIEQTINKKRKKVFRRYFKNFDDAVTAIRAARVRLHGEFCRHD